MSESGDALRALAADYPALPGVERSAALVRVLAATHASGVILLSGDGLYPLAPFLLEGVDMGGRLIVNVENPALAAALQPPLSPDIRCTVHCQQRAAFLADIHRHHFNLVLLQYRDAALAASAAARLARYGVIGFYDAPPPDTLAAALAPDAWRMSPLGEAPLVIAARTHVAAGRRGGRRGRAAVYS